MVFLETEHGGLGRIAGAVGLIVSWATAGCGGNQMCCGRSLSFVDKETGDPIVGACVEWTATTTAELGERSPGEFLDESSVVIGATDDAGELSVPVCGQAFATSFSTFVFNTEGTLLLLRLQSPERTDIVTIRAERQYRGLTDAPAFLEITSDGLDIVEVSERGACRGSWDTASDLADDLNTVECS